MGGLALVLPLASLIGELGSALSFAFGMLWEILRALILGFRLSGVMQAVVSKRTMTRLLPDASPRSPAVAAGLGAFYVTMVAAGFAVEILSGTLGLTTPTARDARVAEAHVALDYTTVLSVIFLAPAALLLYRFFRAGGPPDAAHDGQADRSRGGRRHGAWATGSRRHREQRTLPRSAGGACGR